MQASSSRTYGYPLAMIIGFCVGASATLVTAYFLSLEYQRFSFKGTSNLLLSLGSLGTYLGHVVAAAQDERTSFKPLGTITAPVFYVGAAIVLIGSFCVLFGVFGLHVWMNGLPRPR